MTPAPIPAPRDHGYTSTTTTPLYWCVYGPREAVRLLVLHGGPGAHHDYLLPQFLDLADEYELVFYDQRGGGRSKTDDPAPVTWRTHVEDLDRVAAELGFRAPSIVGYSWGAMLALLYAIEAAHGRAAAANAPARLVLVSTAAMNSAWRDEFEAEFARRMRSPEIVGMRDALAASGMRERDPAAYRQRAFELSVAGYFADPRKAADLTPFRVTGRVQDSVWSSLGSFDLVPEIGRVRLRSLVVHGRQDPIPIRSAEAAAQALGAEFVALDACGHVPYVERRSDLFTAIRRFLERTNPLARS